jgi:hypothetical protein
VQLSVVGQYAISHNLAPVDTCGIPASNSQVNSLQTPEYIVSWIGLVYVAGELAGVDSLQYFLKQLPGGIASAVEQLKGVYFIILRNKASNETYAFTDSSGLLHAFHSADQVSTSFLDLVTNCRLGAEDLCSESVVEFFHFGYLSFGRTFFEAIHRLDPHQIAHFDPNGRLSFVPKCIKGLDQGTSERSFEDLMRAFAISCSEERVSVDLTGGIDSRLLAVVLDYLGIPFDLAVSGVDTNEDVAIARQVSALLRRELYVTHHDASSFEELVPTLFTIGDGLFDVTRCHGPLQLQRERVARGITLMVSGVGGELFKDFWWLQDFPFYARRRPNLSRLYSTRIAPVRPEHHYLTEAYAAVGYNYDNWYLQRLGKFTVKGNTQTYDNVYRSVKMPDLNGRFVSNHVKLLRCYLPFLEPEIAALGYRLPRSTRFFNRFHRQTITHYRPDIAALRTTEGGMTVSSERPMIAADISKYVLDRFSRLMKKCGEKVFHKRSAQSSPNDPGFAAAVRNSGAASKAFGKLNERGIIRGDLAFHDIKDSYMGNLITLAMLFEHLDNSNA